MRKELKEVLSFVYENNDIRRVWIKHPFDNKDCQTCLYLSASGLVCTLPDLADIRKGRCRSKEEKDQNPQTADK